MKKFLSVLFVMLLVFTGCTNNKPQPEQEAETVTIQINTDGIGIIAAAQGDEELKFDDQYPAQSIVMNVEKGTSVTMEAKEQEEDYVFVKWTKDGADYATDKQITVVVDTDVEYRAVFMMSSGYEGATVENIEDAKVIGDILGLPTYGYGSSEDKLVYAFELKGVVYRAVARLEKATADAIFALDFSDPEYEKKYNELVAPLAIDHIDNLNELIPSQEELDKNIGKTGGDLVNEGWHCSYVNFEDGEAGMDHGFYSYVVKFDDKITRNDDAEMEDLIKDMKVVSVTYEGIGDAANPEID